MKKLPWITLFIFLGCVATGIYLSSHKLLWNDELFTQVRNIEHFSLADILKGKTEEGNLCPLFYAPQKILLGLFHYSLPFVWKYESCVYEPYGQILIRLPAVIYMSLALALIFYAFSRYYSYRIGCFALALALTSPMVWLYWAEARPYGLWFLLTVIQSSLFLKMFYKPDPKNWIWLGGCHVLLSLTIIFSVPQILIVSAALCLLEKTNWKKILWTIVVPVAICWFYYNQAKKVYEWMPANAVENTTFVIQQFTAASLSKIQLWITYDICLNVPKVWGIPLILYAFFLLGKKISSLWSTKTKNLPSLKEGPFYLFFTLALLISAVGILVVFAVWESSGTAKYPVSERYFIFLVPYALTAMVISYVNFIRLTKDFLLRLIIRSVYLGTMVMTALISFTYIASRGIF